VRDAQYLFGDEAKLIGPLPSPWAPARPIMQLPYLEHFAGAQKITNASY
jgi:hypothetical protein